MPVVWLLLSLCLAALFISFLCYTQQIFTGQQGILGLAVCLSATRVIDYPGMGKSHVVHIDHRYVGKGGARVLSRNTHGTHDVAVLGGIGGLYLKHATKMTVK